MKKLDKKNLDELAKTMNVIANSEMETYYGMYSSDCFWRCVAYMQGNHSNYNVSEGLAASYALSYYSYQYGCSVSADYRLSTYGAGVTYGDIQNYIRYAVTSGVYSSLSTDRCYIGVFNNNDMSSTYVSDGGSHAVVVLGTNSDGSTRIFDAQSGDILNIPANQASNISKVMY